MIQILNKNSRRTQGRHIKRDNFYLHACLVLRPFSRNLFWHALHGVGLELQELPHKAFDLFVEALEPKAKGILSQAGIDPDLRGVDITSLHQHPRLLCGGERLSSHELRIIPPRLLAEDIALIARDVHRVDGSGDMAPGHVVNVHRRAGERPETLAQEHGQDHGVGALHALRRGGGHVVAAQDEGRVQVDDVKGRPHRLAPRLGGVQGCDLGVGVRRELGVVRARREGDAVGGPDGGAPGPWLGALHLGHRDECHDGGGDDDPPHGAAALCCLEEAPRAAYCRADEEVLGQLAVDGWLLGPCYQWRGNVDDMGHVVHGVVVGPVCGDIGDDGECESLALLAGDFQGQSAHQPVCLGL